MGEGTPVGVAGPRERSQAPIVVALAGQPNVGKTTVFNILTGLDQHVGNWPGKTVERKTGVCRRGEAVLHVTDLPGIHGLTAASPEERIARDFVIHGRPDVVIALCDATALERSLYLVAELLALPAPVVVGLTMLDLAADQGISVEPHVLEAALGVPVVPLVATRNQGVQELVDAAVRVARYPSTLTPARPAVGEAHRGVLTALHGLIAGRVPAPVPEEWVALKLLEGDKEITDSVHDWLPSAAWDRVQDLLRTHEDAILDVVGGRYEWIERMVRAAVRRPRVGRVSVTDRLDRVATHPWWGPITLLGILGVVFSTVFAVAIPVQRWLDVTVIGRLGNWTGDALEPAPDWVGHLLVDGVITGTGLVLTLLPVLVLFFAAMAVLEDSGYLTRAAYVTDRFMHHLGLHGKSFLPLVLGFGCNVPAVLATRIVESPTGRLRTILLAPLVPCAARLGTVAFLAAVFFGGAAPIVATALVTLNLVVLALVGALLSRTFLREPQMAFIMEMPLYRRPRLRSVTSAVWGNTRAFVVRAGTLIVGASALVWALSTHPGPEPADSVLATVGRALEPLGQLMGMDWRLLVALMSGFVVKENAVATLGILYGTGTRSSGLARTLARTVPPTVGVAFMATLMLFVPCVATVAAIRKETGSWRWPLVSVAMLLCISLTAGILVYQAGRLAGIGV